jgi:hypothetical protein
MRLNHLLHGRQFIVGKRTVSDSFAPPVCHEARLTICSWDLKYTYEKPSIQQNDYGVPFGDCRIIRAKSSCPLGVAGMTLLENDERLLMWSQGIE